MEIIHNRSIFAGAFLYQAQVKKKKSQTGSDANQGGGAGEFQIKNRHASLEELSGDQEGYLCSHTMNVLPGCILIIWISGHSSRKENACSVEEDSWDEW